MVTVSRAKYLSTDYIDEINLSSSVDSAKTSGVNIIKSGEKSKSQSVMSTK